MTDAMCDFATLHPFCAAIAMLIVFGGLASAAAFAASAIVDGFAGLTSFSVRKRRHG